MLCCTQLPYYLIASRILLDLKLKERGGAHLWCVCVCVCEENNNTMTAHEVGVINKHGNVITWDTGKQAQGGITEGGCTHLDILGTTGEGT